MPSHKLTSIVFILPMLALMASCGAGTTLRVSQITPRAEALQCVALRPIQSDEWLPAAANPDLSVVFARYGIEPSAATQAIEQAAGDYARVVQITEQNAAAQRDLLQSDVNVEVCNRQRELRLLIEANNAGPQE